MLRKPLGVLLLFVSATLIAGVFIHPAAASVYNWTFSITKLSQTSQASPSLVYNPNLGKIFFAYGSDTDGCCGNLNIISSTDMTTWTNNVDTGYQVGYVTVGLTYNPDDQRMYAVFPQVVPGDSTHESIRVISSSDGTSWSSMVVLGDYYDISNYANNGPEIVFDSTNHRLLVAYNSWVSNTQGDHCSCNEIWIYQSTGPVFNQSWSQVGSGPVKVAGSTTSAYSAPSLAFVNGKLYMAYITQDGANLHVAQSSDGITWTNKVDFTGQTGYFATIAYNPVEQNFHMAYVGVTNPFYLYDNTSPDGVTWTGPTKLSGAMSAESLNDPSMAFIPTTNVLLLGFTGTDGGGFFGESCPCHDGHLYTMPEVTPADNAQFISQTSPPSPMNPGQTATVSLTMKNTGTTAWLPPSTDSNPFRLGSQNPQDNTNWGFNRVDLGGAVAPGSQYTFSFTITAPSTSGVYNFQWRMVQDGVTWFGDFSPNIQVTVGNPTTIEIYTYPTTDTLCRSIGLAIDQPLPVPWWPPYQSGYEIGTPSSQGGNCGSLTYYTYPQLAAGSHYVQVAVSGFVPSYAWHAIVYVNGAQIAQGDVGRNQILQANFNV